MAYTKCMLLICFLIFDKCPKNTKTSTANDVFHEAYMSFDKSILILIHRKKTLQMDKTQNQYDYVETTASGKALKICQIKNSFKSMHRKKRLK